MERDRNTHRLRERVRKREKKRERERKRISSVRTCLCQPVTFADWDSYVFKEF